MNDVLDAAKVAAGDLPFIRQGYTEACEADDATLANWAADYGERLLTAAEQSAEAVARAERRIVELEAALRPFCKLSLDGASWGDDEAVFLNHRTGVSATVGDFRRAAATLTPNPKAEQATAPEHNCASDCIVCPREPSSLRKAADDFFESGGKLVAYPPKAEQGGGS